MRASNSCAVAQPPTRISGRWKKGRGLRHLILSPPTGGEADALEARASAAGELEALGTERQGHGHATPVGKRADGDPEAREALHEHILPSDLLGRAHVSYALRRGTLLQLFRRSGPPD